MTTSPLVSGDLLILNVGDGKDKGINAFPKKRERWPGISVELMLKGNIQNTKKILVIGATGYIGGHLVSLLLEEGYSVRVMARDPERLVGKDWIERVEVRIGDLLEPDTLKAALKGIHVAFYLAHSMYHGVDFEKTDRQAANNFVKEAQHIELAVYLGGIQPPTEESSPHLRSRGEVGRILRAGLPTTEFRAGPIIGSGSASFDMLKYLTERLPVMILPHWVKNQVQPLAIRTVIAYLAASIKKSPLGVVDVGSERRTFLQLIEGFAQVRGLKKRIIIKVPPFLPPCFVGNCISRFIPIPQSIVVPLLEGIAYPITADTEKARTHFPEIKPMLYKEAVKRALQRVEEGTMLTSWDYSSDKANSSSCYGPTCIKKETSSFHLDHTPPKKSKSLISDIYFYLFSRPTKKTTITFSSKEKRRNFRHRIMQRVGINVDSYSILNIHQIGINAPSKYVYEDLLTFDAYSSFWPNHIATMDRQRGPQGGIYFYLFGKRRSRFFSKLLRPKHFQIFKLSPMKIQNLPDSIDFDNARYLLFKCSGGYPIGFFSIYTRSSVADQKETEPTQLFFIVGFNFYGKKALSSIWILRKAWELLHDRVTANVLNRYKRLCEYQFEQIQKGEDRFQKDTAPD